MANPKLTIEIVEKGADGVVKSIKTIEKAGSTTYTKLLKDGKLVSEQTRTITGQHKSQSGAITAISTGYMAAAQAYGAAKSGLDGLIAAASEELDSIRNRDVALKNAGDTSLKYKDALEKQAQQFMTSLGVADDYTREIQAQLLIQHKAPADIEMMTQATMGLTLQQDIGAESAARQIAKFVEQGGRLRGTTLQADANSTAQGRMKQAYDFTTTGIEAQRKKMQESEGKIDAARVKYGELREELGLRLLPVVSDLAGKFGAVLDKYNGLDPGAQNLVLWTAAGVAAIKPLGIALGRIITSMKWILANPVVIAGGMVAAAGAGTAGTKYGDFERLYLQPGERVVDLPPAPITKVHAKEMMLGPERAANQYGQPIDMGGNIISAQPWYRSKGVEQGASLAGSFMGGGVGGLLSAAGGMFGGPLGALGGGLLGKLFGGGGKKQRGETPGQPLYTADIHLASLLTDLLNVTKMSLIRGGSLGIDSSVKQLNLQNARAGI